MRPTCVLACLLALTAACGGGGGAPAVPTEGLQIETVSLPAATAGQPYGSEIRATGGTGLSHTWRITAGSLPPGMALTTGRICPTWSGWITLGEIPVDAATAERSEISGLAASRRNPGILWVHDDSGAEAVLHAIDASGALRQRYVLAAAPVDWEDICLGPGPNPDVEYLYIGDVGDNGSSRTHVTLLRVEEPLVPAAQGPEILLPHEAYALTYPGGPRDCEALLVDWDTGTPYLLEKSGLGGDAYRVPLPLDPTWTAGNPGVMVAATTTRPLPDDVTGADAARDGTYVVFRTYGQAYVQPALGAGLESAFAEVPCPLSAPILGQYEALALAADGLGLYTTTEQTVLQPASGVPLQRSARNLDDLPGAVRGRPTASGTWTVTVEVEDSSGARATRTFDVEVR